MEREEVDVNKNARPISSHLEGTSLVNKDLLLLWPKRKLFPHVSGPAEKLPACSTLRIQMFHVRTLKRLCLAFLVDMPPDIEIVISLPTQRIGRKTVSGFVYVFPEC